MVPLAPRYDPLIVELVRSLDDRTEPIAETVRRVGEGAALLGLFKPSYSHLRRIVHRERNRADAARARREAVREVVLDVAARLAAGRFVDPAAVAEDIMSIRARERLVALSHKPNQGLRVRPP